MKRFASRFFLLAALVGTLALPLAGKAGVYDATTRGKEILTPASAVEPRMTGASVFGVRPGKPVFYRVSATGKKPVSFRAEGLPAGLTIDQDTGWITGRAPVKKGDVEVTLHAENDQGRTTRILTLRVGDTICLTPPMGWNSWYVHSEGVSDKAIREMADAMAAKGLTDHGWTYVNIDDCWMGERDPETKAIQPNGKFGDMKQLVEYVNSKGLKLGTYSTCWMSTFAGYIGGTAPNEEGDYSAFYLPEEERLNPYQTFGRHPNSTRKGLTKVGPVWFVDRDAKQFAEWGIDYVKYDWTERAFIKKDDGTYNVDRENSRGKLEKDTKRFFEDFRAQDRDTVLSLSPRHDAEEDAMVTKYCNLWRLTKDIKPDWEHLQAAFSEELIARYPLTRPGLYGDLDMLQIGPMGKPNRAEKEFHPSPLTPAEQYLQVTFWSILSQPLLLSCNVPTMDAFDLNLVCNDEVLAVNQDPLVSQAVRVAYEEGRYQIWVKQLADDARAVALINLADEEQVLPVSKDQVGTMGTVRDLWRQKDIRTPGSELKVRVNPHGAAFFKVK